MQTKKKMRQEKETKWVEKLKKRGGFTPKRAKHWGDPCSYDECGKWEDGECAYQERDTKGCYMLEKQKGKQMKLKKMNILPGIHIPLENCDKCKRRCENFGKMNGVQNDRKKIANMLSKCK